MGVLHTIWVLMVSTIPGLNYLYPYVLPNKNEEIISVSVSVSVSYNFKIPLHTIPDVKVKYN